MLVLHRRLIICPPGFHVGSEDMASAILTRPFPQPQTGPYLNSIPLSL